MSTRTETYLEAVQHLPEDAVLVLHGVTWDDYEQLLEDMNGWPGMRITYYKGMLEIVSPSPRHEKIKAFIDNLVAMFCEERDIAMENLGSTTFKQKKNEQGAEPDVCFHVTNVEHIAGKDKINPDFDPVPDIAVEIDISNESTAKFEIHRTFGMPEIWRYDGNSVRLYRLAEAQYVEIPESRFFPELSATILTSFVEQSRIQGRTAALAAFRHWLQTHNAG